MKRKRWRPKKKGLHYKCFHKFWLSSQNSCDFPRILKWRLKKKEKRSSSQKFYDIPWESTKITKKQFLLANSRALKTNLEVLRLDLHSSSPEPANFFGAQSSLGGHNFRLGGHKQSFGGARPRNAPPWRRACLDGTAWDFAQAKWWRWWKTVRCGGLISSCCPRNPHGKAGNEERRRRSKPCTLGHRPEG